MEVFSRSPTILEMVKVSIPPGAGGEWGQVPWAMPCYSLGSTGSIQAAQVSTEKEANQGPEAMASQDPKLKATSGPPPSTRPRCLSETEEQQDPQPVWDKDPLFWRDTLTWELLKLFTENQQGQEGEALHLLVGGALGVPANLIALHLSPPRP